MKNIIDEIFILINGNLNFQNKLSNKSILILGANSFVMSYFIFFVHFSSSKNIKLYLCTSNKHKLLKKFQFLGLSKFNNFFFF